MSTPSEEQGSAEPDHGESVWSGFTRRFQFLSTALAAPRPLTVSKDSPCEDDNFGNWIFSPPFLVLDRFQEVAQQAGKCLGSSGDVDPLCFWLDHLSLYLRRRADHRGLRIRDLGAGRIQTVIDDVIEASTYFSRWLSESPSNAISVLTEESSESPPWKRMPSLDRHADETPPSTGGEVWAAKKNRQQEAQARIFWALQRLEVPSQQWPDFVQAWHADERNRLRFSYEVIPAPFQAPSHDRLTQSPDEWRKAADIAWKQHRDQFIARQEEAEKLGIDEKLPAHPKTRGQGKTGRNSGLDLRYQWAALRLIGTAWKEIAFSYSSKEDRIRKAASEILKLAGWLQE